MKSAPRLKIIPHFPRTELSQSPASLVQFKKTLLTRRHQRLKLYEFFCDNKMAIEVKENCQYSISNDKKTYLGCFQYQNQ